MVFGDVEVGSQVCVLVALLYGLVMAGEFIWSSDYWSAHTPCQRGVVAQRSDYLPSTGWGSRCISWWRSLSLAHFCRDNFSWALSSVSWL